MAATKGKATKGKAEERAAIAVYFRADEELVERIERARAALEERSGVRISQSDAVRLLVRKGLAEGVL